MRHSIVAAAFLLAACSGRSATNEVSANAAQPAEDQAASQQNAENELTANPNGTQTLRLEGNDTATFVDGELVEVNRDH